MPKVVGNLLQRNEGKNFWDTRKLVPKLGLNALKGIKRDQLL